MTNQAGTQFDTSPTAGQTEIERETAEILVRDLTRLMRDLGNAGVSDPNTSRELEDHLKSALAAAYRWQAETAMNQRALDRKKR